MLCIYIKIHIHIYIHIYTYIYMRARTHRPAAVCDLKINSGKGILLVHRHAHTRSIARVHAVASFDLL